MFISKMPKLIFTILVGGLQHGPKTNPCSRAESGCVSIRDWFWERSVNVTILEVVFMLGAVHHHRSL